VENLLRLARRALLRRGDRRLSLKECGGEDGQIRTIDGGGAPGGDPARRFHEAAGIVGEQAGAGVARAGDAHRGNRARAAADHGGNGAAAGAVLQDERGVLAEFAEFLRFGSDQAVGKSFGD
jgi:hypothetical protein